MKRYKITIVNNNLSDINTVKKIIDSYCMNIVDVEYFLSIEEGLYSFKTDKPDIIVIDYGFWRLVDFSRLAEDIAVLVMCEEKVVSLDGCKNKISDFIQKPFVVENVALSINKAIKKNFRFAPKPFASLPTSFLSVVSQHQTDLIEIKDIMFCMADGKYTTFHLLSGAKVVSCKNLGEYEKQLCQTLFYRIHHGYIINVNYVKRVIKKDRVYCELADNVQLPLAKRKQALFYKFIRESTNLNLID